MKVTICDLCGKVVNRQFADTIKINKLINNDHWKEYNYEICSECSGKIINTVNVMKKRES